MSGKAKFVFWQESPFDDIPSEPMFNVTHYEDDPKLIGSTLCGATLMQTYGISIPLFPDLKTWKHFVDKKERCRYCWMAMKGPKDIARHAAIAHPRYPAITPSMAVAYRP